MDDSANEGGTQADAEPAGQLVQALEAACATTSANVNRTGFITGTVGTKVTTNDSYGNADCPDTYRINLSSVAAGAQTISWGDAARTASVSVSQCNQRKLTVQVWDRATDPPTLLGSRVHTGTHFNSTQCLNPEVRLDGWLTVGKSYRIAIRAETTGANGAYTVAPMAYRTGNLKKCANENATGCWEDLTQPARYPIGVGTGIACWLAPQVSSAAIQCYKPKGKAQFTTVSPTPGSNNVNVTPGEPNWAQIPIGTVIDIGFAPFTIPANWIIPTGSDTTNPQYLYVLTSDGTVYRSPPGQPPNGTTTQWVYIKHHFADMQRYMLADATIRQIQYIQSVTITGFRARRANGTLASIDASGDVPLWKNAAMPSGWPSSVDDLSGGGSTMMWARKGNSLYYAGATEPSSGVAPGLPIAGSLSLQDGATAMMGSVFDCEVAPPGNPSGELTGTMRGACLTDLKRYLRFDPGLVGTPAGPWSFIPGYTGPWDVEPGSGIASAALDVKDAQRFRGRPGEVMTIHGFGRMYAYIP